MRLRWSVPAVNQLISIRAFIAKDDPAAAARVAAKIMDATDRLERFPFMGRVGRIAGSRELVIPGLPYIVGYRIVDDVIDVSFVTHTSQKWPKQ